MTVDLLRVKAERVAKGYSQLEMAKKMGFTSRSSYSKRERGEISFSADELINVANILGFSNETIGIFFKFDVPKKQH